MAQVPIRMSHQPGLVHPQRPPIMVSMHQPPPNSMPGMASMSPMMAPNGIPVMTQGPPPMAQPTGELHHHDHHQMSNLSSLHHQHHHITHQPYQPSTQQLPHQVTPVVQQQQEVGEQLEVGEDGMNKEKTPMCLVNELARYNKIQHQYRLTDESGPAHKKTFTVTLKLGEEEYTATGQSIKKAQHSAATVALSSTEFEHPPPKQQRHNKNSNITPTVELNALAMKRGEPAIYTFIEPPRTNPYLTPNLNFRGMYNQRYHYQKTQGYTPMFYVSLRVGTREFIGEGHSAQAARHSAAGKALKAMKDLPIPENVPNSEQLGTDLDPDADLKSPISLVHEIALKRSLQVGFEVVRESGPPHMRKFATRCLVGDMVTEGEGSGKKVSKKIAAEKMLDELRKLPPLPTVPVTKVKRKPAATKKKSRNLIKEQKASPEYGQGINPISRLIQIQQAKKEKEPIYTLIDERGLPRKREFVMQVTVGPHTCTGNGPNKKLAKRAAAEALLQSMGYSRPPPQPAKSAIKHSDSIDGVEKNRKVTFVEDNGLNDKPVEVMSGRQLAPGLLLMNSHDSSVTPNYSRPVMNQSSNMKSTTIHPAEPVKKPPPPQPSQTPATHQLPPGQVVRPKDQLMYLAQILEFQVQFTDFPKGNKSEFLSLVSLSTKPPHVSHGAGTTIEASHDEAAMSALRALSEMGLDTVSQDSSGESNN